MSGDKNMQGFIVGRLAPVHVAFSSESALRLNAEAEARNVKPQVLAMSLVGAILRDGLVDSILDGDSPEEVAGGKARHVNGLTHLRCAVLYLMALHTNADGVIAYSANQIAVLLDRSSSGSVSDALLALEERHLIRRFGVRGNNGQSQWQLTEDGWSIARELGDIRSDGGAA